jgi:hypothetical protein
VRDIHDILIFGGLATYIVVFVVVVVVVICNANINASDLD